MDINQIKEAIVKNVYHIDAAKKVPLHKHDRHNEIFYCIAGEGFGVLEDREITLTVGEIFHVTAGTLHALRTDSDLYVASFLIPIIED